MLKKTTLLKGFYVALFLILPLIGVSQTDPDTDPPVLISFLPSDGSTEVSLDANFTLQFNENVELVSGVFMFEEVENPGFTVGFLPSEHIFFNESGTVILDVPFDLEPNRNYIVTIEAGIFRDESGNVFEGISDTSLWNFSTVTRSDTTAPELVSTDPLNNATNVSIDTDVELTFNEEVQLGTSNGFITNNETDELVTFFFPESDIVLSGNSITIDVPVVLDYDTEYRVQLGPDTVEDLAGNNFGSIPNSGLLFTTMTDDSDTTAPTLVSTNPSNNAIDVAIDADVELFFNEQIQLGSGNGTITNVDTNTLVTTFSPGDGIALSGNGITIDIPVDLEFETEYIVQVDANTVADLAGNNFEGIPNGGLSFTTIADANDTLAPLLLSFTPATGTTEVALDANFILQFNENVALAAGIFQVVETDTGISRGFNPLERIVSNENGLVELDPPLNLEPNTNYHILINEGIFLDADGNAFEGISDTMLWNFSSLTSADTSAPELVSLNPADNSTGVPVDANFSLTFNEAVQVGQTGFTLFEEQGPGLPPVFVTVLGPQGVTADGNTITIDPFTDLEPNTEYRIQVNPGNIEDLAGNDFFPQLPSFEYTFTTGTVTDTSSFITIWRTDNSGTSEDNQITIPTFPGETYNYTVDWGDGNSDVGVTGDITHTYAVPGTYTVSIAGDFPRIYFNGSTQINKSRIIDINQWGGNSWTSMRFAFNGCINMDVSALDTPNLFNLTSLEGMFRGCKNLVGSSAFINWNTSSVVNMRAMFNNTENFNQDIGDWDVSNVTNMSGMFQTNFGFNQDIGRWDVSKVIDMSAMFNFSIFNQDIGDWDVSNVTLMFGMFGGGTAFNQDIGRWDVSKVTDMNDMFSLSAFNQEAKWQI